MDTDLMARIDAVVGRAGKCRSRDLLVPCRRPEGILGRILSMP